MGGARFRYVYFAVGFVYAAVDAPVRDDAVGALYFHPLVPVRPRAAEYAAEVADGFLFVAVGDVFDDAVFNPAQFGVRCGIVVGVEGYCVVERGEVAVGDFECFAAPEVHAVLLAVDDGVAHDNVFERANLYAELPILQVEAAEVFYAQVFYVEEREVSD